MKNTILFCLLPYITGAFLLLSACSTQSTETVSVETTASPTRAHEVKSTGSAALLPTPTEINTGSALDLNKSIDFWAPEVTGTISLTDTPSTDLQTAAKEAGQTEGTWFQVEIVNHTDSQLRPQIINLHLADSQHFQAYGEIATLYTFAKKVPGNQTIKEIQTRYASSAPLEAGEATTIYFYNPAQLPESADSGSIQFLLDNNNLIVDLMANR